MLTLESPILCTQFLLFKLGTSIVLDHVYNFKSQSGFLNKIFSFSNKSKNIRPLRNGFWQDMQNKSLFLKKCDLEIL